MDTKTAIATLQIAYDNIGVEIGTLSQKQQAIDFAIQFLNGTLVAQLDDLNKANATVGDLQNQLSAANSSLVANNIALG